MSRPALSAVTPSQRFRLLDVLRGFAILGILLINVHFYSRPIYAVFRDREGSAGPIDQIIQAATMFLVAEKFFSILSVLFGIGMAILFERALDKGASFLSLYLRRLVGLFAIGITHALTLYSGDFIGNYAVLGLFLIFFSKARPRTLLAWSAITLLVPCLMMAPGLHSRPPESPVGQEQQAQEARQQKRQEALDRRIQESTRVYGHGTVSEIFRLRSREVVYQYSSLLFVGWKMFSMFLLGLWCWRTGLVKSIEQRLPFVRLVMWISLVIGLVGCSLSLRGEMAAADQGAAMQLAAFVGQELGAPALGIFYMCAITLLYFSGLGRRLLGALAPVGRMAMSNYVFQSIVCTSIFYSYGLGLYGRTTYGENVLIALGMFVLQLVVSHAWLRRFSFGPLEWVLRSFVYLRRPAA